MNDDINALIAMLRTDLQSSVATTLATLDELASDMAGASEDNSSSQTSLLNAIKAQVGVAMAEVERFDNSVNGQLGVARDYAKALAK